MKSITFRFPGGDPENVDRVDVPPRPFFARGNVDDISDAIRRLSAESMGPPVAGCDCYECTMKRERPPWAPMQDRAAHSPGYVPLAVEEGKRRRQEEAEREAMEADDGSDEW